MMLNLIIKVEIIILLVLILLYLLCIFNNRYLLILLKKILCKTGLLHNKVRIIDNLWLGDFKSSQDEKFIKKNNIKLIINVSKDLQFLNIDNIKKIRIPIHDDKSKKSNEILLQRFGLIYNDVKRELDNNNGVLVHCKQGIQRSAAFVTLFIMKYKNMTNKKALDFIKKKKPCVFYNNCNFNDCLKF